MGSYNYEALEPERFQQFCQALIAASFPSAQCLPVGQPDGGRDALVRTVVSSLGKQEIYVFQVKFSRNPSDKSEREQIESVVRTEGPKISELQRRGVKAYYLLTNVSSTSHLDSGSADIVNAELSKQIGFPAYCWWRNDLDRRLDNQPAIKWSFPDIIRGSDLLQALLTGDLGDDARRRSDAIKAYLASQHKDDEEVKFKQVELQNKLIDLFVDIPVAPIGLSRRWKRRHGREVEAWVDDIDSTEADFMRQYPGAQRELPGAANFFLNWPQNRGVDRVVLEGAPGQGKSTISQFVCQVHRLRLLDKKYELGQLPPAYRDIAVRLPMRVDLRDFASWLGGRDPFASDRPVPSTSPLSLEGFLSHQISTGSGGFTFAVSDLTSAARGALLLIVLDGFDEVADIPTRNKVVEEISKAASRMEAVVPSALFLVTSRPAAFANSPGFPEAEWDHFELHAMNAEQVQSYASKWMSARRLSTKEQEETRNVLNEKLVQPHMRDLSRNPMQLAILLALINTRGLSLPDKRTALYDSYIELFFSREAEKSEIVREHRDLLVILHRYLAWVLHSEAEEGGGGGSVTTEQLKEILKTFLDREGHNSNLVDLLFQGMVERVVALVSRVQGTFEFEVQPLREYFAARYLYETAPYSPAGGERTGTKPDRFWGISRNFYWLNVTRFYCGCYSSGELASLADGLAELSRQPPFDSVSHPLRLAFMLLGDWVFNQQPTTQRRVLSYLTSEPRFRLLLATRTGVREASSLSLPEKAGRSDLVEACKLCFEQDGPWDFLTSVGQVLIENTSEEERQTYWKRLKPTDGVGYGAWFERGVRLDLFRSMARDVIDELVDAHPVAVPHLIRSGHLEEVDDVPARLKAGLDYILGGMGRMPFLATSAGRPVSLLERVAISFAPRVYRALFAQGRRSAVIDLPFSENWHFDSGLRRVLDSKLESRRAVSDSPVVEECLSYVSFFDVAIRAPIRAWHTTLAPWTSFIEEGRRLWGDRPTFYQLAILAAGIRSKTETGISAQHLLDSTVSLCERARFARLQSGSPRWWLDQLQASGGPHQTMFVLLALFAWGTTRTLVALREDVSQKLDSLRTIEWHQLCNQFGILSFLVTKKDQLREDVTHGLPGRFVTLLGQRADENSGDLLYENNLKGYRGDDTEILEFSAEMATRRLFVGHQDWQRSLEDVRRAYSHKVLAFRLNSYRNAELSPDAAEAIAANPIAYPQQLVAIADELLTNKAKSAIGKVGAIAASEKWFAPP